MRYYPINLDIKDRNCLVIGGGAVGTRKVRTLLECGARVTVVSPVISESLRNLAEDNRLQLVERHYDRSDLEDMFLVIGATNDEQLNQRISEHARQRNLLCNIADRPEACTFILPSIINRGDLCITISTSGKSPAMAKRLRKHLSEQFGPEYIDFLRLMGNLRMELLSREHAPEAHKQIFEQLIDAGMLDLIRARRIEKIDELLQGVLGKDFSYARLMSTGNR